MLINFQGGDNNLGVILGSYQPDVQCTATHTGNPQSCLEILADMPATTDTRIFGPQGHPGVQENLPIEIASSTVTSISPVDPN